MRYAVLADVHGNLHALERVLELFEGLGVDRYLVAGDLVGYCAFPNECVERVRELDPVCVAGNHDLIALGLLSDARCIEVARQTLRWTAEVLSDESRDYLAALPVRAGAAGVTVAHGSLDDPQEYVVRPQRAVEQLRFVDDPILVLGHTHRAWACDAGGSVASVGAERALDLGAGAGGWVLNPGAVGQSRELRARARCLLLDLEQRRATFYALRYDVAACREALVRRGLPAAAYHLRPSPRRALVRRARRVARSLR
jgi:predicted phosphodiesterase